MTGRPDLRDRAWPKGIRDVAFAPFGRGRLFLTITLSMIWFLSVYPAVDNDYGWHVENGRHVLDGTAFSGRDLYSWTASGYWVVHEWATEAAMSMLHDWLGRPANSVAFAVVITVAFALVGVRIRRRGAGWLATILTVWLGFFGSLMSTGVRPQMLELAYLAALGLIVDTWRANRTGDRWFFGMMTLGAVVWANTHGSFLLMPAILGLISLGLLVDRDSRWTRVAAAAALSAALAAVNPWGWRVYDFATQSVSSKPTLALIEEWNRPDLLSPSLIPFDVMLGLAAIAAAAVLVMRVRNVSGGAVRGGSDDVAVALGLAFLAITSGRHVMLFGIGAAPLVARTLDSGIRKLPIWRRTSSLADDADPRTVWMIHRIAALVVIAALVFARSDVLSERAQQKALASVYPVGLLDEVVRLNKPPARLLNDYDWGGFLIENGATPVFIDGRSEVYGDAQLLRYSAIISTEAGWMELLDSLGVTLVLTPRESKLQAALRGEGWQVAGRDSVGTLLTRCC